MKRKKLGSRKGPGANRRERARGGGGGLRDGGHDGRDTRQMGLVVNRGPDRGN